MPTSLAASCTDERGGGTANWGSSELVRPGGRRGSAAGQTARRRHPVLPPLIPASWVRWPAPGGCARSMQAVAARLRQEAPLLLGAVLLLAKGAQDAAAQGAIRDEGVEQQHAKACAEGGARGCRHHEDGTGS